MNIIFIQQQIFDVHISSLEYHRSPNHHTFISRSFHVHFTFIQSSFHVHCTFILRSFHVHFTFISIEFCYELLLLSVVSLRACCHIPNSLLSNLYSLVWFGGGWKAGWWWMEGGVVVVVAL